jgi:CSLREA domain-containing protein
VYIRGGFFRFFPPPTREAGKGYMMQTNYLRASTALLLAIVAAVLVAVLLDSYNNPASAQSSTTIITVNTKEDEDNTDGDCSLREAIRAANENTVVDGCAAGSDAEQDAILFSLGDKATITLGSTLPTISNPSGLTIDGQKAKIKVSGNDAVGVGVFEVSAKLTLNHLIVADGNSSFRGAGLLSDGGEVQVLNSTFSGNSATDDGGGIANFAGTLEVTNSTFSKNSAMNGGAILNAGTLTVTNSTFSKNNALFSGGGIANATGTLEVTNSTFSKNSAGDVGGGIRSDGGLEVTNSTFSKNSAPNDGGGGIMASFFGTATLKNTIVANSPSGGNCRNEGPLTDGGYNIEDGTSCGFDPNNNSMPSTEPKLAKSLAKNGGPTKTIALLKGSPALNAIREATNGCGTEITTDQRGVSRPQGAGCDIGAYEKKK